MRHIILMVALISLLSCGQGDTKQKELELKEKELALREKELELKERELKLKENDTIVKATELPPEEKEFTIGKLSKIPKYFDEIAALNIYESFSPKSVDNYLQNLLFIGDEYENKGMCAMNINNELVELKFVKSSTKGQVTTGTYSNGKYTVTYILNNNNVLNDADPPIVKGTITVEGRGFKKFSRNIVGSWESP